MTTPVYNSGTAVLPQGQEVTVDTIASIHGFYDAFIDARGIQQPTEWRVYAVVGTLTCLIATGKGPINSLSRVQWQVEKDVPEGGGASFILKAINRGVGTIAVPYTFCGFDYTSISTPNQTSGSITVNTSWQTVCQLSDLFQCLDIDVQSTDTNCEFEIELLSRPGVGGVEVPIAVFSGKLGNGPTRIFEKVTLTPGDLWTVRARSLNGVSASLTAAIAGYNNSPFAGGGGVTYPLLLPGDTVDYGGNSGAIQSPRAVANVVYWGGKNSAGNANILAQNDRFLTIGDDDAVSGWSGTINSVQLDINGRYGISYFAGNDSLGNECGHRFNDYTPPYTPQAYITPTGVKAFVPVRVNYNSDDASYPVASAGVQSKYPGLGVAQNLWMGKHSGGDCSILSQTDTSLVFGAAGANGWGISINSNYCDIRGTNGISYYATSAYHQFFDNIGTLLAVINNNGVNTRSVFRAYNTVGYEWVAGFSAGILYFGGTAYDCQYRGNNLVINALTGFQGYSPNYYFYDDYGNALFYHTTNKLVTARGRRKHNTVLAAGDFPYTVVDNDEVIYCNPNAAAARTIFLSATPTDGDRIEIKLNGNFDEANPCTIDGNGKTIDGAGVLTLAAARKCAILQFCDAAADWMIISVY